MSNRSTKQESFASNIEVEEEYNNITHCDYKKYGENVEEFANNFPISNNFNDNLNSNPSNLIRQQSFSSFGTHVTGTNQQPIHEQYPIMRESNQTFQSLYPSETQQYNDYNHVNYTTMNTTQNLYNGTYNYNNHIGAFNYNTMQSFDSQQNNIPSMKNNNDAHMMMADYGVFHDGYQSLNINQVTTNQQLPSSHVYNYNSNNIHQIDTTSTNPLFDSNNFSQQCGNYDPNMNMMGNYGSINSQNAMIPIPNQMNFLNHMVNDFNIWMANYKNWMENQMREHDKASIKKSHHKKTRRRRSKDSIINKSIGTAPINTEINDISLKKTNKKRREHPIFEYQRCLLSINNVSGCYVVVCNQFFYENNFNNYVYIYWNVMDDALSENFIVFPGPLSKENNNTKPLLNYIQNKIDYIIQKKHYKTDFGRYVLWKLMYNLVNNKGVIDYCELAEIFVSMEELNPFFDHFNATLLSTNLHSLQHSFFQQIFYGNYHTQDNFKNLTEICMNNNLWALALSLTLNRDDLRQFVLSKFITTLGPSNPLTSLICYINGINPPFLSVDSNDFLQNYRLHLAIILANTNPNIQFSYLIFKSFGERFYALNMVLLAHFCFLIAGIVPSLSNDIEKFSLIGFHASSTVLNQVDYAAYEDSIILTEIYEYTRQFADDKFVLLSLLPLKFTMANILFEKGYIENAWQYCEHVSKFLQHHYMEYSKKFIYDVFKFSQNLFFRLSSQLIIANRQPDWLNFLANTVQNCINRNGHTDNSDTSCTTNSRRISTISNVYQNLNDIDDHNNTDHIKKEKNNDYTYNKSLDTLNMANNLSSPNSVIQDHAILSDNQFLSTSIHPSSKIQKIDSIDRNNLSAISDDNLKHVDTQVQPIMFFNASNQQAINIVPPPPPVSQRTSEKSMSTPQVISNDSVKSRFVENDKNNLIDSLGSMKINSNDTYSNKKSNELNEDNIKSPAHTSGVFGSLFSKLLPNKNNKVFLPDDNEPSHIFDEKTNKWINIKKDPNECDKEYSEAPPILSLNKTATNSLQESNSSLHALSKVTTTPSSSRERLKNRYVPPNI